MKSALLALTLGSLVVVADPPEPYAGCPVEATYTPKPAPKAAAPKLPPPELRLEQIIIGDRFTAWGAAYHLRSRRHRAEVTKGPIAVMGYITKTNLPEAPKCSVHRGGQADPENCKASIPAFWVGDRPDAPEAECIKVMGFASNYAQIFDAIRTADRGKGEPAYDTFWGQIIPDPLPAKGAKVVVSGNYGTTFSKASSGIEVDDVMGILDYREMQVLAPAAELATLPGVLRKPR